MCRTPRTLPSRKQECHNWNIFSISKRRKQIYSEKEFNSTCALFTASRSLSFACPIHRLNGKRPKGVNSHRERKHDKHKKTIKGKQTKLCDERETHSSTTFKKLVPENDSHETSFHPNFFLVTSSLYFRSAAVCVSTTLIRPIRRRAPRHDTPKHF